MTAVAMVASPAPTRAALVRRPVVGWLCVLFALLLAQMAVGGYVRLSGSGLSIPDWPLIRIGEARSLLPPVDEAGWNAVRVTYHQDQADLAARHTAGALGLGSLGARPGSMAEFQRMFLIEWSHRALAALVSIVALGCLVGAWRDPASRPRCARLLTTVCGLIVVQALLGGMLVKSGTSTHWLFLHLGTAAAILGLVVWSILALGERNPVSGETATARRRLQRLVIATVVIAWLQIVFGALVAGSRISPDGTVNFVRQWPLMLDRFVPHHLWSSGRSAAWNLLDNALLHQWVHRWFAALVLLYLGLVFLCARRTPLGIRARLGLQVCATFLGVQVMLGLANVFLGVPVLVALAHLVTAMSLFASLILVLHDVRHEPTHDDATAMTGVPA